MKATILKNEVKIFENNREIKGLNKELKLKNERTEKFILENKEKLILLKKEESEKKGAFFERNQEVTEQREKMKKMNEILQNSQNDLSHKLYFILLRCMIMHDV